MLSLKVLHEEGNTGCPEQFKVEKWIEAHAIPVIEEDEGAVADWPESKK